MFISFTSTCKTNKRDELNSVRFEPKDIKCNIKGYTKVLLVYVTVIMLKISKKMCTVMLNNILIIRF